MTDNPSGPDANTDGRGLLIQAWDEAADGYAAYFAPRFLPWIQDAVAALRKASPPAGTLVVPGCGPGLELCLLAQALPEHAILGLDPAQGMCRNARDRTRDLPQVTVRCEDATDTITWPRPCTGLLSCFVLQLLPEPETALSTWMAAVEPGGILSVVFWPAEVEQDGPFATLRRVLDARLPPRDRTWEGRLEESIHKAGGRMLHTASVPHVMGHPDAAVFWEAMTRSGPLRPLLLSRGAGFMEEVRRAFLAASPDGELVHEPRARLLVARRP